MKKYYLEGHLTNKLYESEFLSFYKFNEIDLGVCKATSEYIPIEHFKKDFKAIGSLIVQHNIHALIFDKRSLNTFHQPSMEWYYTEWKAELLQNGLKTHYKILPAAPWFAKSVEAGKHDIKKSHPEFDFNRFLVNYLSSLDEAVDHWKALN